MNYKIAFPFFLLLILLTFSCKKEETTTFSQTVPGTISLAVHAVHHSWDVSGIMIYLKKDATDFPGKDSSIYDYKGSADGYGKFTFEDLYPGNYYVLASGYDVIWGSNVIGYLPVSLNKNNVIDNYFELTLPVSE